MRRFILSTIAAGVFAVGANAAALSPETPSKDTESGCYIIKSANELAGFAQNVVNAVDGNKSACAKVTQPIVFNENILNDNGVLKSGANYSNVQNFAHWEAYRMVGFSGAFDGNNQTISGLYCGTSEKCGLFESVGAGAVIKKVKIVDSYLNVDRIIAGGIVAEVDAMDGKVTIDSCSFSGTITGSSWATDNRTSFLGGLVGKVSRGIVIISNSFVSGRLLAADVNSSGNSEFETETVIAGTNLGALVGGVESGASVTISKSSAENVTVSASEQNSQNVGGVVGGNANAEGAGVSMTEVTCDNTSGCANGTTLAEVNSSLRGVTLSYNGSKLIATLDDSVDTLIINENITVDSAVLAREFTQGVHSTVAVPFEVAPANVVGGVMCRLDSMTHNDDGTLKGVAGSPETGTVLAFYAYLIDPVGTKLEFKGPITLKAPQNKGDAAVADIPGSTGWKFIGVTAKKRWQAASGSNAGENAGEIGRVYGFSANVATSGEHQIAIGDFVKVGSKVTVRPMRGFIYYATGSSYNSKPAPLGLAKSAAEEVLSVDELPERLEVIITYPTSESQEQEDVPSEGPLALDPIKAPAAAFKADRWYDITGRNLNKPKAQGAYINNRTTVIAK